MHAAAMAQKHYLHGIKGVFHPETEGYVFMSPLSLIPLWNKRHPHSLEVLFPPVLVLMRLRFSLIIITLMQGDRKGTWPG